MKIEIKNLAFVSTDEKGIFNASCIMVESDFQIRLISHEKDDLFKAKDQEPRYFRES